MTDVRFTHVGFAPTAISQVKAVTLRPGDSPASSCEGSKLFVGKAVQDTVTSLWIAL